MPDPQAEYDDLADGNARPVKPWIKHKPEQRFSVVVKKFLNRALVRPCYFVANQDADSGGRTEQQRARDSERGIVPGQLDWEVEQGPPHLFRRLELKRGKNKTSDNQDHTIKGCADCGAPPVVAWTLRQVYEGLANEGFRFVGNVETILQQCEADLEAMDRTAEAILLGTVVKPPSKKRYPSKPSPARIRKAGAIRARVLF